METRTLFLSFPVALGIAGLLALSPLAAGTEHIVVSDFFRKINSLLECEVFGKGQGI